MLWRDHAAEASWHSSQFGTTAKVSPQFKAYMAPDYRGHRDFVIIGGNVHPLCGDLGYWAAAKVHL